MHTSKMLNRHSITARRSVIDMRKSFYLLEKARQGMQKYHQINSKHQLGKHRRQVPYATTSRGGPQGMDGG